MSSHPGFASGVAALGLSAACLLFVDTPARGAVLPFTVGSSEGNGAETYVRGGSFAGNNYNSALQLLASNGGADLSQADKVYMRFDLSQVPGWNGVANTASINIPFIDTQTGSTPGAMDWGFRLYAINDGPAEAWDPATINWNNAPGNNPASASGVGVGTTLIAPLTITGKGEGGITSYSAALDQLLNSDTNDLVSFILVRDTAASAGADYVHAVAAPQEGWNGPLLTVPEPAGAAVLLVAGGVLSARRRRA